MVRTTHQRLARGRYRFKQLFFGFGQVDAGAVATLEALFADLHLFAFELTGDANDGHNNVCSLRRFTSRRLRFEVDLRPDQLRGRLLTFSGRVLHMQSSGLARLKVDAAQLGFRAISIEGGGNILAIQSHAEESIGHQAQVVIARLRGSQRTLPADAERVKARHLLG